VYNDPGSWHFRFNGPTPEALVKGRERTYFEHYWNDFAADKNRSLSEADRAAYTAAYARPRRMRASWAYFVSFPQAAKDFEELAKTKLTMPVLAIGGEKANGTLLGQQMKIVATKVALKDTGHWVMEERPKETMEALDEFFVKSATGGERTSRADLDRFRKELGTEYLDICLMHCVTESDWTERYKGVMDVPSEAKEKGIIRAHGCSCHSIEALRAAAKSPWVEVDLVRMNPIGSHMDADPETVASVIREMRAVGKGIIGMKILGQGDLRGRQDEALKYALSLGLLDAFTIGAESKVEQQDLVRRIASAA
jgi:hypothetical protein